jgi:hypothetical protein
MTHGSSPLRSVYRWGLFQYKNSEGENRRNLCRRNSVIASYFLNAGRFEILTHTKCDSTGEMTQSHSSYKYPENWWSLSLFGFGKSEKHSSKLTLFADCSLAWLLSKHEHTTPKHSPAHGLTYCILFTSSKVSQPPFIHFILLRFRLIVLSLLLYYFYYHHHLIIIITSFVSIRYNVCLS